MAGTVVHHLNLRDFCVRVLEKLGVPPEEATIVANSLVLADLRGVETHGVRRLPSYAEFLRAGVVHADSRLSVLEEFPAGFSVDGGHGFGQVVAARAMQMAIERAKDTGLACVAVRNGGHIGAHGNVAIRAAEAGMLGLLVTNGRPVLAPPGGKSSAVSSTPFAIGCPSGREFPLVLDMALSVVARGHILRAIAEETQIPPTWAVDAKGHPTVDPREASRGSALPVGGYKGYGLAVMLGMLGGVLSGAAFGKEVAPHEPPDPERPFNQGHFVLALDIRRFMPMEQFVARAEAFIDEIKATPLAEDAKEIFVPGEQSYRRWRERLQSGIPLTQSVVAKLRELGEACEVAFDSCASAEPQGEDGAFEYVRPTA